MALLEDINIQAGPPSETCLMFSDTFHQSARFLEAVMEAAQIGWIDEFSNVENIQKLYQHIRTTRAILKFLMFVADHMAHLESTQRVALEWKVCRNRHLVVEWLSHVGGGARGLLYIYVVQFVVLLPATIVMHCRLEAFLWWASEYLEHLTEVRNAGTIGLPWPHVLTVAQNYSYLIWTEYQKNWSHQLYGTSWKPVSLSRLPSPHIRAPANYNTSFQLVYRINLHG